MKLIVVGHLEIMIGDALHFVVDCYYLSNIYSMQMVLMGHMISAVYLYDDDQQSSYLLVLAMIPSILQWL